LSVVVLYPTRGIRRAPRGLMVAGSSFGSAHFISVSSSLMSRRSALTAGRGGCSTCIASQWGGPQRFHAGKSPGATVILRPFDAPSARCYYLVSLKRASRLDETGRRALFRSFAPRLGACCDIE